MAHASADELRAAWGPFVGEAGTYEVTSGSVITMRPLAAKNPAAMVPGAFITYSYKLEGDTPLGHAAAKPAGTVRQSRHNQGRADRMTGGPVRSRAGIWKGDVMKVLVIGATSVTDSFWSSWKSPPDEQAQPDLILRRLRLARTLATGRAPGSSQPLWYSGRPPSCRASGASNLHAVGGTLDKPEGNLGSSGSAAGGSGYGLPPVQ